MNNSASGMRLSAGDEQTITAMNKWLSSAGPGGAGPSSGTGPCSGTPVFPLIIGGNKLCRLHGETDWTTGGKVLWGATSMC
jgi:hypothetical protein